MEGIRKPQFLLAAIAVAALAPFLNKAFHIDDPLFLWMARQIAKHPLDPYGFSVNWAAFTEPFWAQMQNPPLCSYFIALIGSLAGWSELSLHIAFLIWPVLSAIGIFRLAQRFCRQPLLATLLAILTPVFLVSSTNLMCDVMLLSLWVWSVELWLTGLETSRAKTLVMSSLLVAAALLTKYFGVALVPLLAAYTIARSRRDWPRLFYFVIPIVIAAGYEIWTKSLYGRGLLSAAMFFSHAATEKFGRGILSQTIIGLTFSGGCILAPLFFTPRQRGLALASIGLLVLGLLSFFCLVPIDPAWALGKNVIPVRLEGGLFTAIGLAMLALAFVDLARSRNAESLLLALWLFGTFAFVAFLNWSITARTILPMMPPAAILLVRFLERNGAIMRPAPLYLRSVLLAAISLGITAADYFQANSAREATKYFVERHSGETSTLWFESHWGFQYYMEKAGAQPLPAQDQSVSSGHVIVVPANGVFIIPIAPDRVFPPEEINFGVLPLLTTAGRGSGACFYSSIRGPLPWAVDHVQPEMYYVARFR